MDDEPSNYEPETRRISTPPSDGVPGDYELENIYGRRRETRLGNLIATSFMFRALKMPRRHVPKMGGDREVPAWCSVTDNQVTCKRHNSMMLSGLRSVTLLPVCSLHLLESSEVTSYLRQ